jgi:hypothetical protein
MLTIPEIASSFEASNMSRDLREIASSFEASNMSRDLREIASSFGALRWAAISGRSRQVLAQRQKAAITSRTEKSSRSKG